MPGPARLHAVEPTTDGHLADQPLGAAVLVLLHHLQEPDRLAQGVPDLPADPDKRLSVHHAPLALAHIKLLRGVLVAGVRDRVARSFGLCNLQ